MVTSQEISILIPTLNRSGFLERTLKYYDLLKFEGKILIGDSSSGNHASKNIQTVNRYKKNLDLDLIDCPKPEQKAKVDWVGFSGEAIAFKKLLRLVKTEFVVTSGDDDFLIPQSLLECAEALDKHTGYSGFCGGRLDFQVSKDLDTGEVTFVKHIPYYAIDSDKGVDRWKTYAEHAISPLYSVIRTQDWLEVYEHFDRVSLRYIGSEFLPSALMVIRGKIGILDRLMIIHQDHANRVLDWNKVSFYSMLIHPKWSQAINNLREIISTELVSKDSIAMDVALDQFDSGFWKHFSGGLNSQYGSRYPANCVQKNPVNFRTLLKLCLSIIFTNNNDINANLLKSVLNPSNYYHQDFMPVFRLITQSDE